jgi:hypothetical protein
MDIPLRDAWGFQPERLSPAWTLHKGRKAAQLDVWSSVFGWELRLSIGQELIQSQVVRSAEELTTVQAEWRAAMNQKEWN